MIKVLLHGRMGNQLFQFAFATYTAKKLQSRFLLTIRRKDGFLLKYFNLQFPFNILSKSYFLVRLNNLIVKRLASQQIGEDIGSLNSLEEKELINDRYYVGFFQNANYAVAVKNILLKRFKVKNNYFISFKARYPFFFTERVLVIHVRLGDYLTFQTVVNGKTIKWLLPAAWYNRAISREIGDFNKVVIITDDRKNVETYLKLDTEKIIYTDGNEITDFLCLQYASTAIISNSSFAWWACFLNNRPDKKIIAPMNWVGYNAGFEYPSGIMTEEFIWVE